MLTDHTLVDRIADRLFRTLEPSGGPVRQDESFTVGDLLDALVPYRTYRHELQADTVQDYEHAVMLLLAGEHGYLIADDATVSTVRTALASPDPDTTIVRSLARARVSVGVTQLPESVRTTVQRPVAIATEDESRTATAVVPVPLPAVEPVAAPPVLPLAPIDDLRIVVTAPPTPAVVPPAPVTVPTRATTARITPLGTPAVYGDPIEFRGLRHAPVDIGGVLFLFGMVARDLGIHVEAVLSGFPRCEAKRQVAPGRWQRLRVDFEVESRHFREAGRRPAHVDLLVCWRDTWPDRPSSLEVMALEQLLPTLKGTDLAR
jgi:hypothetical protein